MKTVCAIFVGIFLLQFAEGKLPDSLYGDEILNSYATELLKPLMSKTNDLNNTLLNYWNRYDQHMNARSNSVNLLGAKYTDSNNDTCKDLQEVMAKAQSTVNNATVLLVEVLQKMAYMVEKAPSCATINIFSAASCIAHKAQDIRNIYRDYRDQIVNKEIAAAKAINEILLEFINCLRRL